MNLCIRCEGRALFLEKGIRKAANCSSSSVKCKSYMPVLPLVFQEDRFRVASLFEDVKLLDVKFKRGRKVERTGLYSLFSTKEIKEMDEPKSKKPTRK